MVIVGNPGKEQTNKGSFYKRGCPYNGELNLRILKTERFIRAMINFNAKLKGKDILSFDDIRII